MKPDKKDKGTIAELKIVSIGIGVAIGAGLGISLNNIALGIGVGVALAAAFYTGQKKRLDMTDKE